MWSCIFVGDVHADTVAPRSRKDDYYKTLRGKLDFVKDTAKAEEVKCVIFSGDLFHKQDPSRVSYALTNYLIDHFKGYSCPVFVAMGNHDIQSKPDRWERQPLGALVKATAVEPLWTLPSTENPEGSVYITWNTLGGKVIVSGVMYDYSVDEPGSRPIYYGVKRTSEAFHVHVVHGMMLPDGMTFFGNFSNPADLMESLSRERLPDVFLMGHAHDYLGRFVPSWKDASGIPAFECYNPGALMRGTVDEFNLKRAIRILKLEVSRTANNLGWCSSSKFIDVPSEPADDVFYLEEIHRIKTKRKELEKLAEMLGKEMFSSGFSVVNPDEAMQVVFQSRQVSPEVEASVRDYVLRSRQIF